MNKKFSNNENILKEVGNFIYRQITDLGAAFLPTARGTDLPLPEKNKVKEEIKIRSDGSKRNDLETL